MVKIAFTLMDKHEVAKFKQHNIVIAEVGEKVMIEVNEDYVMQTIKNLRANYELANDSFDLHFD